jgi:hypothetical protein
MRNAGLFLGICCLFVPASAEAQLQRADSLRVLNEARSAQARFERIRRHFSPSSDEEASQPCQVTIGRMCYWDDNDDGRAPAESDEIVRARFGLISTLDRLAARSPHDDWIAGERVRYMVQAGADSAAISAAQSCAPARWYCNALRGYAMHGSERYGDAAAEYDSALAAMPLDERCRWNDISVLLDDGERERYQRIPCGQRDSLERHFWDLAQPSFVVAGNDRRTEHFSRVMLADLSETAENAYGLTWGSDLRELLIRYGEPRWYSTTWPRPFSPASTPIGHDGTPSFHFAADVTDDGVRWDAYSHNARERYAPPYIDTVTHLNVQFAMMKRGDSALVIAVYTDSMPGKAVLGVSGGTRDSAAQDEHAAHVRRALAQWKPVMVAMEEFDPARRQDARAREWLSPPSHVDGAPDLSTLLLFRSDSSAGIETLDDALSHALTDDELRGARRLGVYWEEYGSGGRRDSSAAQQAEPAQPAPTPAGDSTQPARDDSSGVVVTVVRTDGGVLKWLGNALHITSHDSPLAVRWHDENIGTGVAAHSVVLDLAQLPAGNYRVTVAVGADDAHRTETSRQIRLR